MPSDIVKESAFAAIGGLQSVLIVTILALLCYIAHLKFELSVSQEEIKELSEKQNHHRPSAQFKRQQSGRGAAVNAAGSYEYFDPDSVADGQPV